MSGAPSIPPARKRIIACCDGTWNNGLSEENKSGYTNVLRISRALESYSSDANENIPQIVYYATGIGSDPGLVSYSEGMTGEGLASKVEEAYAFLAGNYVPGDELFLFGFSRGAYTARMVAGIIGEIGILDKVGMESFPTLFLALQQEGKAKPDDVATRDRVGQVLKPFRDLARAQIQAAGGFLIKLVGVFDTVGSLGLPTELHKTKPQVASLFGFSNTDLGAHIQLALHALALDETRRDFLPTKWTQTAEGRAKGQVLKQVWFSGSHSDIGGGWDQHDLSDLTLAWMVSQTEHLLSFDKKYIQRIPDPTAPYGEQQPHNPLQGMFSFAAKQARTPPTATDDITHETIHFSVTKQIHLSLPVSQALSNNKSLVQQLEGFEASFASAWIFDPSTAPRVHPQTLMALAKKEDPNPGGHKSFLQDIVQESKDLVDKVTTIV
ncbi:hypothetical protein T439DRAFT_325770 [Meredithblackwellia eburnea MCA 4105]